MPRPQIPTKSYFIAGPKFPYLSGKLINNKVSILQVVSWEAVQPNTACLTSIAGGGLLSLGGVCG